jgi:hypothetical protein
MPMPRKHHVKKDWQPDTLEMQRRVLKLMFDNGYPEDKHISAAIDIRQAVWIHYYDRTITVTLYGVLVYNGHDDTGPWFKDEHLREKISEALGVLRQHMLLEDLANL